MKPPKPVNVPEEIAARYTNTDQPEKFDAALRKILAVPRAVILEREAEYQRKVALNPNPRGPRRKRKFSPSASRVADV